MDIRQELLKYAKWYDRATMPEDAQTDEADLVQNVESYLQTEGKNLVQARVMRSVCKQCEGRGSTVIFNKCFTCETCNGSGLQTDV